jgi:hypothetical protein
MTAKNINLGTFDTGTYYTGVIVIKTKNLIRATSTRDIVISQGQNDQGHFIMAPYVGRTGISQYYAVFYVEMWD